MWSAFVHVMVSCFDRESANLLHLPATGGPLDQPVRTMAAVEVVRGVFAERLREEYQRHSTR